MARPSAHSGDLTAIPAKQGYCYGMDAHEAHCSASSRASDKLARELRLHHPAIVERLLEQQGAR